MTCAEWANRGYEEWIVPKSSDAKKRVQWLTSLKNHAFPIIGSKPIHVISRSDIFSVMNPIWATKHETARRVRQRMAVVFDYAVEAEFRRLSGGFVSVHAVFSHQAGAAPSRIPIAEQ